MSAPFEVWHYDGSSAVRHLALFELRGDRFALTGDFADGPMPDLPLADLQPRDGRPGEFGLKGRPGWRIGFAGGVPAELAEALPQTQRYGGGIIDRIGLVPAAIAFAVVAALALWGFLRTPSLVARAIPASVEARLGELMVGDMGGRACSTAEGTKALEALARRIGAGTDIKLNVVPYPMVNAATLPGGQIIVFDGLIQAARSPDEVAGVIGHEIGHVRNRDVMEGLLRQLGLSVILGGMEGHVGSYTNALLAMSYSRDAERRADDYAIGLLSSAKVAPGGLADFMKRTAGTPKAGAKAKAAAKPGRIDRIMGYFASHPDPAARAARFVAAAKANAGYTPALDPNSWAELRQMCKRSPKQEDGWNF